MRQSKQRLLLSMLLLLAVTGMGLTACSGDDIEGFQEDGIQQFSISVTDGGYSSALGGIHTKAAEKGYQTVFSEGDRIGVFAVKSGAIRPEINNLCLIARIEDGNLVWKDTSGKAPLKFSGATYYAYYPYLTTLTEEVDPTAGGADDFFANVIGSWLPDADQSTYTKYTAQDLMVAQGVINNNKLSFAMQHQMSLVVIELPGTKYSFSNANPLISDYIIDPLDTRFDNYRPFRMMDGMYRYLVNIGPAVLPLTGSYTNASKTAKGWSVNPAGISSGSYKLFQVDGGMTAVPNYSLQVGDFMMKDGTLMSKDVTLNQRTDCIGIVFWIGDPTKGDHHNGTAFTDFGDPALKRDHPGCRHGLVVAVEDISPYTWQDISSDVGAWVSDNTNYETIITGLDTNDALNKLRGYNNTQAIKTYNQSNSGNLVWPVLFIDLLMGQKTAPAGSSDWYLPSIKELSMLYSGDLNGIMINNQYDTKICDIVNVSINKAAGITIQTTYWSSSEYTKNSTLSVTFDPTDNSTVLMESTPKQSFVKVRTILAF